MWIRPISTLFVKGPCLKKIRSPCFWPFCVQTKRVLSCFRITLFWEGLTCMDRFLCQSEVLLQVFHQNLNCVVKIFQFGDIEFGDESCGVPISVKYEVSSHSSHLSLFCSFFPISYSATWHSSNSAMKQLSNLAVNQAGPLPACLLLDQHFGPLNLPLSIRPSVCRSVTKVLILPVISFSDFLRQVSLFQMQKSDEARFSQKNVYPNYLAFCLQNKGFWQFFVLFSRMLHYFWLILHISID